MLTPPLPRAALGAQVLGPAPHPKVRMARAALARAPIRLLHLEDAEADHALALAHLRRDGLWLQPTRVETRGQFAAALHEPWDLILSDYHLPGFTGLEALEMVRVVAPELPFILVSGQIGEDTAVLAMRQGASDYLLKHNLARLVPAVEQALAAAEARRARAQVDRELAQSRQRLSELAQHLQTSVENERHAIAREIHDDVGGALTALKFELDGIRRHAQDGQVLARLEQAQETLTQALGASQRIMQNLRPAILEQGLVAALQWMSQQFERRTGMHCRFISSHEQLHLPSGVPLVAYRTAQEALTNVTKHAQATQVVIDLSLAAGTLSLEVADNGCGIAERDLSKAQSFGIRGLHERASTVGGWVELTGGSGGTTLILSVPVAFPQELERSLTEADEEEQWTTHY